MLHALVRPDDELQAVPAVEVLHSIWAESARVLPSWRHVDAEDLVVVRWVGPECVENDPVPPRSARVDLAADLYRLRDATQVLYRVDAISDAAVYAEDGAVDQCRDR